MTGAENGNTGRQNDKTSCSAMNCDSVLACTMAIEEYHAASENDLILGSLSQAINFLREAVVSIMPWPPH